METVNISAMIAVSPVFLILSAIFVLCAGIIKPLRGAECYAALLASLVALVFMRFPATEISLFGGLAVINGATALVWYVLLTALAGSIFVSMSYRLQHPGTYYFLMFVSAAGSMLVAAADNLIFAFAASETALLPLYFLTACRRGRQGIRAAYRFSVSGILFAALSMVGLAFLNYSCPSLSFTELSKSGLPGGLALVGFILFLSGFTFKLAALPFNFVFRDVFSGAPGAVAAYMASAWTLSGLPVLYKIYSLFYSGPVHNFFPTVAVLTVAAGSLSAFYSQDLRKTGTGLLCAGIGFCLLSFSGEKGGEIALLYHIPALAASAAGLFLFSLYFEKEEIAIPMSGLSGFADRHPVVALSAAVCLFSAAGMPPLGGFFAKFIILFTLLRNGHFMLAMTGIFCLLFSVLCSLKLISSVFFSNAAESADGAVSTYPEQKSLKSGRNEVSPAVNLSIFLLAVFLSVYGIFSKYFLGKISAFF